eukprot:1383807-Amorphochlora_amoeboformis.AAC.1
MGRAGGGKDPNNGIRLEFPADSRASGTIGSLIGRDLRPVASPLPRGDGRKQSIESLIWWYIAFGLY